MARVDAAEYVEKQNRRLKAATEDIRRGIQRVTEAPGIRAAKQKDLMLTKLTEAITSGLWAKMVGSVTLEEWKDSAINKGLNRIAQGIDAASPKQREMAVRLLAAVDASVAEANKTPRGTLEDNITRMNTFVRSMAKRKVRAL